MFNMFVGFFVILMWGIALVFLTLTLVFRKRKTARWVLGALTFFFMMLPVLLFLGMELGHRDQKMKYCGKYVNSTQDFGIVSLELFTDGTFVLNGENCNDGKITGDWDFQVGDVGNYLEFEPTQGYLSQASIWDDGIRFRSAVTIGTCELNAIVLKRSSTEPKLD